MPSMPYLFLLAAAAATGLPDGAYAQMSVVAVGDWGGQKEYPYWTDAQVSNALGMAAFASAHPPRLGLLMGDSFYGRGIRCDDFEEQNHTIRYSRPNNRRDDWELRRYDGYAYRATRGRGPDSMPPAPAAEHRACSEDARHHRFQDTFEKVWDAPSLMFPMCAWPSLMFPMCAWPSLMFPICAWPRHHCGQPRLLLADDGGRGDRVRQGARAWVDWALALPRHERRRALVRLRRELPPRSSTAPASTQSSCVDRGWSPRWGGRGGTGAR
jgi:hypothetical protein